MRKTDISNFNDEVSSGTSVSTGEAVRGVFSVVRRIILTALMIILVTGFVIIISMTFYILSVANEPNTINLNKMKLNLTSFVYVLKDGSDDEFVEYQELYSTENRVWVKYQDIPKHMIDAQIAIEDKRFEEHNGVDWYRTGGAILSLATGKQQFGGSTITQQLIKNITNDNEVSITRKIREIFRALKLEEEYSKNDIIEAYLNVVNYGAGCRGVQSAADLYFNKKIEDCSIAECAAIAGITQNPYAYNPLIYPDNTKQRAQTVIDAMLEQGLITKSEHEQAQKEIENMKFIGYVMEDEEEDDDESDWNWYIDRLFRDVVNDLQEQLHISVEDAEHMIYNEGLHIYCAMDQKAQEIAENKVREWKTPEDTTIQVAYEMMDFTDGRVLATIGSRNEKDGRLLWDIVTQSSLQPGSTIKPISSYVLALDNKDINYSSLVSDKPVSDWGYEDGNPVSGPNNWYRSYYGNITVTRALNISSNAAAVNTLKMVGLDKSYEFLTEKLNFKHLDPDVDSKNLAGLSIGGFHGGTTVEEMTSAYQIFCNGGFLYEPYTYFYVTDSEGKIILDNRDLAKPAQAISTETSTIMNRLLHDVVNAGGEALGYRAKIPGWDIIGKTGTTDSSCDNWFVGASPYAVAGIWAGHESSIPIPVDEQSKVHYLWRDIMQEYLNGKTQKSFSLGGDVVQRNYVISDGYITDYNVSGKTAVGYYTEDNLPPYSSFDPNPPKPQQSSSDEENSEESEDTSNDEDSEESTDENTQPDESSEEEPSEEESSEPEPGDYSEPEQSEDIPEPEESAGETQTESSDESEFVPETSEVPEETGPLEDGD